LILEIHGDRDWQTFPLFLEMAPSEGANSNKGGVQGLIDLLNEAGKLPPVDRNRHMQVLLA
jgi:hypothetical protein